MGNLINQFHLQAMWPFDFADTEFAQYKISHKLKAIGSLIYKPERKIFYFGPPY